MSAVNRDTPPSPTSPWVVPGEYTVVLTVGGKSYTQPLTVKMDPRVKMSRAELEEQLTLSQQLADVRAGLEPIGKIFDSLVEQLTKLRDQSLPKNVEEKLNALNSKLRELGPPNARPVRLLLSTLWIRPRICSRKFKVSTLCPPIASKQR